MYAYAMTVIQYFRRVGTYLSTYYMHDQSNGSPGIHSNVLECYNSIV